MPRFHELELGTSVLPRGQHNGITDVTGVAVGHFTLFEGTGAWKAGEGPFRTGVTLVLPHLGNLYEEKVRAAVHTINGFGKVVGFEQVREMGQIETPIGLTGTLNVLRVADVLMTMGIEENPHIGIGFDSQGHQGYPSINPVVGETNDGYLSDIQARPISEREVRFARSAAGTGPVEEGVVGAGTGTSCFGWKGGIGTASRVTPGTTGTYTVGALVQSNFGRAAELTISGVPVGQHLRPENMAAGITGGSVMIVLATDAPLDSRQLSRISRRAASGLARTGSSCHHGSGDFVIAFSTANRVPDRPDKPTIAMDLVVDEALVISALSVAVIESVEEAIYNSMLMAHTVTGRDGNKRYGLPAGDVVRIVRRYRVG